MNIKVWLQALRLRTLPLALSCIGMGSFLAARLGTFRWGVFVLCILTTVFLQILSNLSNDYGDSVHGADSDDRKGPSRAVQSGAISPGQMRAAMVVFGLLSFATGILLLFVAFGFDWKAILFFLLLGLLSIAAAIAYTVGRKPYGYAGLGDISVFIFFGLVGVLGSFYLFTKHITWIEVFPAITCGLFSVAVLNINNIRDISSDKKAGKQSVPVRIGRERAIAYHWFLLIGGLVSAAVSVILNPGSPWQWLFLLTVPLFIRNGLTVARVRAEQLDPYLKQMALSTLLFVLLYGAGQLLR
jgi:1,4-dihydroxy-2-naphthoate octaprenyltransferase